MQTENPEFSSHARLLRTWLRELVLAVLIAVFGITFLYQPVVVEGTSMQPELRNSDLVFINKLAYRVGDVHRGDVVVFHYPNDPSKSYIKRIIAEPGDTLRIDRGEVWVNGEHLREIYVPRRFRDDRSYPETVIPAGSYFVMGDHRDVSSDSRDFGTVARRFIYGKAVFVYWPMPEAGWVR
jgi:signal peptidase I